MLRILRITGVIVFAILIGFSANSLKQMHESGLLFERYNSNRRANITLLSVSLLAIGALGIFEIVGIQRSSRRRQRYGERRHQEFDQEETDGLDSTSIYASNRKVDDWERKKRSKSSRAFVEPPKYEDAMGMRFLRLLSSLLPLLYAGVLGWSLLKPSEDAMLAIVFPAVFSSLLIISLIAAVGLNRMKMWGLTFGYILALFNLVIFPVGTAIGLFLVLALVSSSQSFADISHQQKRRTRHLQRARA